MDKNQENFQNNLGKLLLRVACGGMLILHGWFKLFVDIEHVKHFLNNSGLPEFLAYGSIVGEIIAPIMIIIGFKTRLSTLIIAVNMLFSIFLAHRDIIFKLNDFGGWMIETNMLYLSMALAILLLGAGKYRISGEDKKWV